MWVPMRKTERRGPTITEQLHFLYPPVPSEKRPRAFTITLTDITAAGLRVVSTMHAHEHLDILGDTVKVLEFTHVTEDHFLKFDHNRVAIALGIDTLGWEIFASFYVLYWRDGYQTEAHALHLLPDMKEPHVAILRKVFFLIRSSPISHSQCACKQNSGVGKSYSISCLILAIPYT